MGTCKYCGKSAGLFSSTHDECEQKHAKGLTECKDLFVQSLRGGINTDSIKSVIRRLNIECFLSVDEIATCVSTAVDTYSSGLKRPYPASVLTVVNDLIRVSGATYSSVNSSGCLDRLSQKLLKGFMVEYFTGQLPLSKAMARAKKILSAFPLSRENEQEAYLYVLNKAATNFMKDGVLTDSEEKLICDYTNALNLPLNNLPAAYQSSDIQKISQAVILKDLQNGIYPKINVALPILLGKNEHLLWAYGGVSCYMEKIQRETVGRSGGFSFRIMKGVTYRTGQFRGHPIEHSYMDKVGVGSLFVTTKNLIFYSESKSAKAPYSKMIGVIPYSDGLEVQKDGNAKRLVFQGFDSWFIMNVLSLINTL